MTDSGRSLEPEVQGGDGVGEPSRFSPRDQGLLLDACRVVVDAWHGQSSVSLDLAMSHLEALLRKLKD